MTKTPLKQRLRCVSCFINKEKESLEPLSFYFRCLAGSTNIYPVYKGNLISLNQIELQIDVSGTESLITAGEEKGNS